MYLYFITKEESSCWISQKKSVIKNCSSVVLIQTQDVLHFDWKVNWKIFEMKLRWIYICALVRHSSFFMCLLCYSWVFWMFFIIEDFFWWKFHRVVRLESDKSLIDYSSWSLWIFFGIWFGRTLRFENGDLNEWLSYSKI